MLVQRSGFVFGLEIFLGLTGLMMPCTRLSPDSGLINKHTVKHTGGRWGSSLWLMFVSNGGCLECV